MSSFTLINYADPHFQSSQTANLESGRKIGSFDRCIGYGPRDIDVDFRKANDRILSARRGGGYWLWKPYILAKQLEMSKPGDLVFYSDSGALFISSVQPLRDLLTRTDMLTFELAGMKEREWTKRDTFILTGCDKANFAETAQRLGSFIAVRRSSFAMDFFREYLSHCCDWAAISDARSELGQDYRGFREHRHDQSILSLLSKKAGLEAFRDPSQYGSPFVQDYNNSPYPQLLDHTRSSDASAVAKLPARLARKISRTKNILRTYLAGVRT